MTQEQMRDVLDLSVEAADYLVAAAERGAGDPMADLSVCPKCAGIR